MLQGSTDQPRDLLERRLRVPEGPSRPAPCPHIHPPCAWEHCSILIHGQDQNQSPLLSNPPPLPRGSQEDPKALRSHRSPLRSHSTAGTSGETRGLRVPAPHPQPSLSLRRSCPPRAGRATDGSPCASCSVGWHRGLGARQPCPRDHCWGFAHLSTAAQSQPLGQGTRKGPDQGLIFAGP